MGEEILGQLGRALVIRDMLSTESWTTRPKIAAELGVDVKTVGRYLKALREMGYAIESVRGKGLRLEGDACEGQLVLTEEELYVLFLSLARSTGDFPEEVVRRLRRRLLNQLSQSSRQKVVPLENGTVQPHYLTNLECLRAIGQSLSAQRLLRIGYLGLKDRDVKTRTIKPLRFANIRGTWYLESWDVDKDLERNFRLDRIKWATVLQEKFSTLEKNHEFQHHPWDFGEQSTMVTLRLSSGLAQWLRESPRHRSQKLAPLEDGTVRCTYEVVSRDIFIDWVIGLRGCLLEGPEEYRLALQTRVREIAETGGTLRIGWEV